MIKFLYLNNITFVQLFFTLWVIINP